MRLEASDEIRTVIGTQSPEPCCWETIPPVEFLAPFVRIVCLCRICAGPADIRVIYSDGSYATYCSEHSTREAAESAVKDALPKIYDQLGPIARSAQRTEDPRASTASQQSWKVADMRRPSS